MKEYLLNLKSKIPSANLKYFSFTIITAVLIVFFFTSNIWIGDSRALKNEGYDITVSLLSWEFKVTDATYNAEAGTISFEFYTKETTPGKSSKPEIYKITKGDNQVLSFTAEKIADNEYGEKLTVNCKKDFYYIRLYIRAKENDYQPAPTTDEFGNTITYEVVKGKETEYWVNIDYRLFKEYSSNSNPKADVYVSSSSDSSSEATENTSSTETSQASENTTATTIPSQTTYPSVTTVPNSSAPSPATTGTAAVRPPNVSSTKQTVVSPPSVNKPPTTTAAPVVTTPPPPAIPILINTISLTNYSNITLQAGQTFSVVPQILPANGTNKNLTWVSNKPPVAIVDNNGIVTAKGSGKAIITCWTTDGTNLSASCMVTVS